ncbi:hypothetical protein NPIL_303971 [Nephila pilipes]|uniref:Uncharacterized protein n=1 Tax=Nephila pilipes TaxID=299642 RepID=A0A8X6TEK1_NEPPI|nr:hypothetical protein NPIL_303971 [Nephila pilipes]
MRVAIVNSSTPNDQVFPFSEEQGKRAAKPLLEGYNSKREEGVIGMGRIEFSKMELGLSISARIWESKQKMPPRNLVQFIIQLGLLRGSEYCVDGELRS